MFIETYRSPLLTAIHELNTTYNDKEHRGEGIKDFDADKLASILALGCPTSQIDSSAIKEKKEDEDYGSEPDDNEQAIQRWSNRFNKPDRLQSWRRRNTRLVNNNLYYINPTTNIGRGEYFSPADPRYPLVRLFTDLLWILQSEYAPSCLNVFNIFSDILDGKEEELEHNRTLQSLLKEPLAYAGPRPPPYDAELPYNPSNPFLGVLYECSSYTNQYRKVQVESYYTEKEAEIATDSEVKMVSVFRDFFSFSPKLRLHLLKMLCNLILQESKDFQAVLADDPYEIIQQKILQERENSANKEAAALAAISLSSNTSTTTTTTKRGKGAKGSKQTQNTKDKKDIDTKTSTETSASESLTSVNANYVEDTTILKTAVENALKQSPRPFQFYDKLGDTYFVCFDPSTVRCRVYKENKHQEFSYVADIPQNMKYIYVLKGKNDSRTQKSNSATTTTAKKNVVEEPKGRKKPSKTVDIVEPTKTAKTAKSTKPTKSPKSTKAAKSENATKTSVQKEKKEEEAEEEAEEEEEEVEVNDTNKLKLLTKVGTIQDKHAGVNKDTDEDSQMKQDDDKKETKSKTVESEKPVSPTGSRRSARQLALEKETKNMSSFMSNFLQKDAPKGNGNGKSAATLTTNETILEDSSIATSNKGKGSKTGRKTTKTAKSRGENTRSTRSKKNTAEDDDSDENISDADNNDNEGPYVIPNLDYTLIPTAADVKTSNGSIVIGIIQEGSSVESTYYHHSKKSPSQLCTERFYSQTQQNHVFATKSNTIIMEDDIVEDQEDDIADTSYNTAEKYNFTQHVHDISGFNTFVETMQDQLENIKLEFKVVDQSFVLRNVNDMSEKHENRENHEKQEYDTKDSKETEAKAEVEDNEAEKDKVEDEKQTKTTTDDNDDDKYNNLNDDYHTRQLREAITKCISIQEKYEILLKQHERRLIREEREKRATSYWLIQSNDDDGGRRSTRSRQNNVSYNEDSYDSKFDSTEVEEEEDEDDDDTQNSREARQRRRDMLREGSSRSSRSSRPTRSSRRLRNSSGDESGSGSVSESSENGESSEDNSSNDDDTRSSRSSRSSRSIKSSHGRSRHYQSTSQQPSHKQANIFDYRLSGSQVDVSHNKGNRNTRNTGNTRKSSRRMSDFVVDETESSSVEEESSDNDDSNTSFAEAPLTSAFQRATQQRLLREKQEKASQKGGKVSLSQRLNAMGSKSNGSDVYNMKYSSHTNDGNSEVLGSDSDDIEAIYTITGVNVNGTRTGVIQDDEYDLATGKSDKRLSQSQPRKNNIILASVSEDESDIVVDNIVTSKKRTRVIDSDVETDDELDNHEKIKLNTRASQKRICLHSDDESF